MTNLDARLANPAAYARLELRLMVAMENLDPARRREGQARINCGEHVDLVIGDIEGDVMHFTWAGFEILSLRRGALAEREPDA